MPPPTTGQRAVEAFLETGVLPITAAECMAGVQLCAPDCYYSDLTGYSGDTRYTPGLSAPDTTPWPGVRFLATTENNATKNGNGTGGTGHGTATEIGYVAGTNAVEMLGQTEPDRTDQANSFPSECIVAWDAMAATGIPFLWSPSTSGFNNAEAPGQLQSGKLTEAGNWLDNFLALLAGGGHRMPDGIAFDKYASASLGLDAAAADLIAYIDAVRAKYVAAYGIQFYCVRETGLRTSTPASGWATTAQQIGYMQRILPLCRMRLPWLRFVGWWGGYMDPIGPSGSTSLFNATGSALTDLGIFWRDFQRY